MPELPEVEVLARHLAPLLRGKTVRGIKVLRPKVIAPTSRQKLVRTLTGAKFTGLDRRGKFLLFRLRKNGQPFSLLGHLGMTGRFFVQARHTGLPKHTAAYVELGKQNLVFEDQRYFGRLTLDMSSVDRLRPEALGADFTTGNFANALSRSAQAIKVKLLDQTVVAGIGNIYASEALFRAGISPRLPARRLKPAQVGKLRQTIRAVLADAIRRGSTIPLNFGESGSRDGLFYFGRAADAPDFYEERLLVYDRAGQPCVKCATPVVRIVQAARSTFFCPRCQR